MEDIRDSFFNQIYQKALFNKDIFFLSADMDAFVLRKFANDMPDQYLNIGVSEQNMINVASGLAMTGKKVFCYSIASFATLRCLEQIKVNICSHNLPVTIIGAGLGFSFGYDGPTHHGHSDLSSMRLIPEMSILELSSSDIAKKAVQYSLKLNKPLYIRLDKGPYPDWSSFKVNFKKGYRVIKKITDINIVTNGFMVKKSLEAVEKIKSKTGVEIGLVDSFIMKPFAKNFTKEILMKSKIIISIEENCKTGGLGTQVSELITQNNLGCSHQVISAPDKQFIEYGEREWFHKKYRLDLEGIQKQIISKIKN